MTLLGVLAFLSEGIFTLGVIFSVLMAVGLMPRETAENDQVMQPADLWGRRSVVRRYPVIEQGVGTHP